MLVYDVRKEDEEWKEKRDGRRRERKKDQTSEIVWTVVYGVRRMDFWEAVALCMEAAFRHQDEVRKKMIVEEESGREWWL